MTKDEKIIIGLCGGGACIVAAIVCAANLPGPAKAPDKPSATEPVVAVLKHIGENCKLSSDCEGSLICIGTRCVEHSSVPVPYPAPIEHVSASTIISAFRSNELRASDTYTGRRFLITGIVSSVSKDILGNTYCWMNNHDMYAAFTNRSDLYSLSSGQQITIDCIVGRGSLAVDLKDCSFAPKIKSVGNSCQSTDDCGAMLYCSHNKCVVLPQPK